MIGLKSIQNVEAALALLNYIATHSKVSRSELSDFLSAHLSVTQNLSVTCGPQTITLTLRLLKQAFHMRITWTERHGYQIRNWGIINREKFLQTMNPDNLEFAKEAEAAAVPDPVLPPEAEAMLKELEQLTYVRKPGARRRSFRRKDKN